jgi:hypothetical protein
MTRIGRLTAQLGITVVLATAMSFAIPVFVDSRDYARAVSNYAKDQSPANDKILRLESATNQRAQLKTHVAATVLLFLGLNTVWLLVARRFGESQDG